jgi:hydrogenase nickel incorporation protein HypA/HybF
MHELSVTESILEIALRYARQNDAKKITRLNLVIGRLASIVDDSVQFYWDIVSQDTICAGSTLAFERLPATMNCLACGSQFTFDGEMLPCPTCGSAQVTVASGDQFYLESIEIEK